MVPATRQSREARAPEAGRARELREQLTPAERVLWSRLRNRQLLGLKFRRQFPIEGFIADFCCYEARLILEVDGKVHAEPSQRAHDENRDIFLHSLGYKVLRFSNQQVLTSLQSVLDQIARAIGVPHPS